METQAIKLFIHFTNQTISQYSPLGRINHTFKNRILNTPTIILTDLTMRRSLLSLTRSVGSSRHS